MGKGYERLWNWFSLSYASWLTLPRVMMHEMPDEWQLQMAELLEEWENTWDSEDLPSPSVNARKDGKFTRWPSWLLNYRRPDKVEINKMKIKAINDLDNSKRCTTCKYDKSETKAACVDCEIEKDGVAINPTNWTPCDDGKAGCEENCNS